MQNVFRLYVSPSEWKISCFLLLLVICCTSGSGLPLCLIAPPPYITFPVWIDRSTYSDYLLLFNSLTFFYNLTCYFLTTCVNFKTSLVTNDLKFLPSVHKNGKKSFLLLSKCKKGFCFAFHMRLFKVPKSLLRMQMHRLGFFSARQAMHTGSKVVPHCALERGQFSCW